MLKMPDLGKPCLDQRQSFFIRPTPQPSLKVLCRTPPFTVALQVCPQQVSSWVGTLERPPSHTARAGGGTFEHETVMHHTARQDPAAGWLVYLAVCIDQVAKPVAISIWLQRLHAGLVQAQVAVAGVQVGIGLFITGLSLRKRRSAAVLLPC